MRFPFVLLLLAALYLLSPLPGYAQDPEPADDDHLGDFEDAATDDDADKDKDQNKDQDKEHDKNHKKHKHHDDDGDGWAGEAFLQFTETAFLSVFAGGGASWVRVHGSGDPEWAEMAPPRLTGEPVIPFFRMDAYYQNVESDVTAVDVSGELGYGPFAFQYRQTHYTQKRPDNDLDLSQILGVYRMSFSQYLEVDLGFGSMTLDGVGRNSGFEFTVPVVVQPSPYVGARFRPAWGYLGDTVKDMTLVATGSVRFVSLQMGYRWVSAGGVSLNGPVIGAAFHF
jgi:hypothetical protein